MKRLPLILILLVTAATAIVCGARRDTRNDRADRAKALYAYYHAQSLFARDQITDALLATEISRGLAPADIDIRALNAKLRLFTSSLDEDEQELMYNTLKEAFFAAPDEFDGELIGKIAQSIGDFETLLGVHRALSAQDPDNISRRMQLADLMGAIGRQRGDSLMIDSALAIYSEIEERTGPSPMLLVRQIMTAGQDVDTAMMVGRINDYIAKTPGDAMTLLTAGAIYKAANMPDSALRLFDMACAADPALGAVHLERAALLLETGDSTRYYDEVADVLQSPSIDFEDKYEMLRQYTANLYRDPEKVPEIARMYDMMQEIHPGESELHLLHGSFLLATDSNAAAAEQLEYAVALDPANYDANRLLMAAQVNAGDTAAAIATGRAAMPRFPDNMLFAIMTSGLLSQQERMQDAIDLLDSFDIAEFQNPKGLSVFHQTRGDMLYKLDMLDSALTEYETAIQLDPSNNMAMNNMAYFMAVGGKDLDRALSLIERAVSIDSDDPTLLDTYAWVLFKRKDYTAARLQIDLALEKYALVEADTVMTTDEKALQEGITNVGETPEEVVEAIDEVDVDEFDTEPREPSADIYDHAGDIYFMNGEPAKALEFWKKALELEPQNEKIAKKVKFKTYFFDEDP